MSDQEFMSHILGEICDYAIQNEMEPDETIGTISRNFLALLTISTFNEWERKPHTNADRIRTMSDEELAILFTTLISEIENGIMEKLKQAGVDADLIEFPVASLQRYLEYLQEEMSE